MEKRNDIDKKYRRLSSRRLGNAYVKCFYERSRGLSDDDRKLERIVKVLKDRAFHDRMLIYELINGCLEEYIFEGDEMKARTFNKMLEYYDVHVLD